MLILTLDVMLYIVSPNPNWLNIGVARLSSSINVEPHVNSQNLKVI